MQKWAFQSKSTFFTPHSLSTAEAPGSARSLSCFPQACSHGHYQMKQDQNRAYVLCYVAPPSLQIQSMGLFTERLRFSTGALDKGWSPKCCFGKDETFLAVFIFNSGDLVRKIFLKNRSKSNSALTKCGLLLGGGREGGEAGWMETFALRFCSQEWTCSAPKLPLRDERESFNISSYCLSFLPALLP